MIVGPGANVNVKMSAGVKKSNDCESINAVHVWCIYSYTYSSLMTYLCIVWEQWTNCIYKVASLQVVNEVTPVPETNPARGSMDRFVNLQLTLFFTFFFVTK